MVTWQDATEQVSQGKQLPTAHGQDQSRSRTNIPVTVGTAIGKVGALPQHSWAADPDVEPLGSNQLNAARVRPMKEPGLMGVSPGLLHHSLFGTNSVSAVHPRQTIERVLFAGNMFGTKPLAGMSCYRHNPQATNFTVI